MKKDKGKPNIRNSDDPIRNIALISEQALKESKEAIINRKKLNWQFLREIEYEIEEAIRMLRHLGDPWQRGDKPEYEFMRISLDKALTARKKERRERRLQYWKDILDLNQKRLELMKENLAFDSTTQNINKNKNKPSD